MSPDPKKAESKTKSDSSPGLADEVKRLVDAAQMLTLHIVKGSSNAHVPPHMVENVKVDFAINHGCRWGQTSDKVNLLCFQEMTLLGKAPADSNSPHVQDGQKILEIDVTFCATYLMKETDFSDEAKKIFCESTALFNTYPYIREFFDNTSRRMGYKPVVIPLLKAMKG